MKQTITLTPHAFECLLRSVPRDSVALEVLADAARSNEPETSAYSVEVSCTREEWQALVQIAKAHCPEVVQQLEGIPADWHA
ncbi:MAG TPA: hypothetical protein VNO43_07360 [Candidatus Eisenbacteria bacterium]|nr:hypothetical protein [Candidatus Eisenbacteria bacterium]